MSSATDLLPLWDVVDGTVITTQGCYLGGVRVRCLDAEHTSGDVLIGAAESLYADWRRDFPDHTYVQTVIRTRSEYDETLATYELTAPRDPLLARQRQRRVQFLRGSGLRRHETFMFVGSALGLTGGEFARVSRAIHERKCAETTELVTGLRASLRRAGMSTDVLSGEEVIELLRDELGAGRRDARGDVAPFVENPAPVASSLREQLLVDEVAWTDDHVRIGDRYYKVLTLKELTKATHFTLAQFLTEIPLDYRLSLHVRFPDQARTQKRFERDRRMVNAFGQSEHVENTKGSKEIGEAGALSKLLNNTGQKLVWLGAQVAISAHDPDELEHRTRAFRDKCVAKGMVWFEEVRAHDREIFKSLPGLGIRFDRWQVVTTNNAVDMLPVFAPSKGDRRPVLLMHTCADRLYNFDPVERIRDNWNAVVFGGSGAGKSVVMNMLITNAMLGHAETRGRMLVVDFAGEEKSSYLMVAKLFGGAYVPVISDSGATPNPFPTPRDARGADGEMRGGVLNFLLVLSDLLLTNAGEDRESALYRVILQRALQEMYAGRQDEDVPSYRDLLGILEEYLRRRNLEFEPGRVRVLVDLLKGFLGSPEARWFSNENEPASNAAFTVFDLFGIEALPSNVQQAITYLVCQRVKGLAFDEHDPGTKYIVLDEVAQLIRQKAMRELFEELYATARKHNTSVWTVTQKYLDYIKSAVAETVQVNSTSMWLLAHSDKAAAARERINEDWGLNGRERRLFASLKTIKGQYSEILLRTEVHDPELGKRNSTAKLRLRLSPLDYEISTSDAFDRKFQRKFIEANPEIPLVDVLEHVARERGR